MIRISYPKEKTTKSGTKVQIYSLKLSSPNDDVIDLVYKILTQLDKETEFYYRATGTYPEILNFKKECEKDYVLINDYYKERGRGKNPLNMELCSVLFLKETLMGLLKNWKCTPTQDKTIFAAYPESGERIFLLLQATNQRYRLFDIFWPYIWAYVKCDSYAKWNTFTIVTLEKYREKIDAIIQDFIAEQRKDA